MAAKELLTDTTIRNAKPTGKPRLNDGGGLYVLVKPTGAKWWRLDYTHEGKRKTLSLGVYPETTLTNARAKAREARELVAQGIDPSDKRKAAKEIQTKAIEDARRIDAGLPAVDSFEEIAREWFERTKGKWVASHADKIITRLENDVFPWIGRKAITEISAPAVLDVLRRIENRGRLETAHRAKGNISQVMRYAIAIGKAERDPCPDLRGALPPTQERNFAAIVAPKEAAELLRAIDGFKGTHVVMCALKLAPLLFVRPGELRHAEWSDIDLDDGEWSYTTSKTKTPHLVPLAKQAVEILRDIHSLTGQGRYVFPGARDHKKAMSEAAINAALRRMGYDTKTEITGHGFRAMARTILAEELHQRPEVIEHQLAHKVPDALGTAYNRTRFLKERKVMMQLWADYLDKLKAGAEVIFINQAA